MLNKPKIGHPCNGCGICCKIQLCNTGAFLLRKTKVFGEKTIKGECPALIPNEDNTFSCGLIRRPAMFVRSTYRPDIISRTVATLIGAGTGCDDLGYYNDPAEAEALDNMIDRMMHNDDHKAAVNAAFQLLQKIKQ